MKWLIWFVCIVIALLVGSVCLEELEQRAPAGKPAAVEDRPLLAGDPWGDPMQPECYYPDGKGWGACAVCSGDPCPGPCMSCCIRQCGGDVDQAMGESVDPDRVALLAEHQP